MLKVLSQISCLLSISLLCSILFIPQVALGQSPAMPILEVQVEGNRTSDASLIITMSGLTVGREITAEDVQDAVRQLYSLGIFKDIQVLDMGQTPEGIRLKIVVQEYPVLERVTIEGNREIDTEEIQNLLQLTQGQVISPQNILRGKKAISSLYREKGFLLAEVAAETFQSQTHGRIILTYTITEGKKVKVRAIEIEGNLAFDDKKIRKQMKTKPKGFLRSGAFKEETLEEDLERIVDFYKREGYRDAEVIDDYTITYDESREGMVIRIKVSEGSRYRFGKVRWEGNELYTEEELKGFLRFREGEIYDQDKFDQTQQNLHTAYTEKGYLYVQVFPKETVRNDVIDINFLIKEGVPAKIHRIDIAGNTKTRDYVIRRELVSKPGDLFQSSAIQRSIREVYQLNFFKDVQIEPEPLENGDIDLTFRVEEKPTGQANFAAGYSARDKVVGSIGLSIPNFRGMGQRLDFAWDFGQIRKTIRFGFSEPWLFGTRTSMGVDVYRSSRNWTTYYNERRTGTALKVGRRLKWPDDYFRLYGIYRWEQVQYTDIDPERAPPELLDIKWPRTTSSISFSLTRDSRDLPEFATSGSVNSYYIQLAGGPLGGDYDYHKHTLDVYWYFPMYKRLTLMLKGQGGIVRSFGSSDYVPFSERFFPGGTSFDGIIRGYDDRSVGPRSQKTEIGGRTMLIFTLEGQFPIVEHQIYGVLFADAGNAWATLSETDPFDLQRSVGFGIRVVAPMIGLIGIDLAYRLDDLFEQKKGEWQPHFQMGTAF